MIHRGEIAGKRRYLLNGGVTSKPRFGIPSGYSAHRRESWEGEASGNHADGPANHLISWQPERF